MAQLKSTYTCPDGTPFPVVWDDPEEEQHGWWWDQLHSPLPVTPLSADIGPELLRGFARAAEVTGAPASMKAKRVNGYTYMCGVPYADGHDWRARVRERDLADRMDRILEIWNEEYRPEVEALTRSLRTLDDPRYTLKELVERIDQVRLVRRRQGELHQFVMSPCTVAADRFFGFCAGEFGDDGETVAAELMQGFPNKSLESAIALWDLAQEAKETAAVAELMREATPADFLARLDTVRGGQDFRALLDTFLDVFGHRNESFYEFIFPTWREEPVFPLFIMRHYLDAGDDESPAAMHERSVREREARQQETEGRLASEPEKLQRFRELLGSAQQRTVLLEDHNFYIDQQGHVAARTACLAIGKRLVEQGTVRVPDDVFYLCQTEIEEVATDAKDLGGLVEERKAERERWMRVLPPAKIGAGRALTNPQLERFFGAEVEEPDDPALIKGIAGSAGVVRGVARFIPSLSEVDRFSPGEILLTYATAPPWTPLFAVAAGIVTDVGGTLSHCAVVAREYGVPAVVGTKVATRRIRDGALITVDGSQGIVRVEE
jgi:pyruvate,water dikinase